MSDLRAFRGSFAHCLRDPGSAADPGNAVEYFEDGVLLVRAGRVEQLAPAAALLPQLGTDVERVDHRGQLIVPGFIDTHVHFPQTDIIASYGEQLLSWLERYTFPAEARFADAEVAAEAAEFFLDQLLLNGTTTALVFATVHAASVDALFAAAAKRGMRLLTGKVLMDRNCPEFLRDTPVTGDRDSRVLIERWHGKGRLHYAITPRFAPTSSAEQLRLAGRLANEFPDLHIQTHLAENPAECDWVARLFPQQRSYLDVYRHFELLRERAVFAHCIHLDAADRRQMADAGAGIAFCPSSNLFLGSGLFDLQAAQAAGIRVGLGTDVGGGTSFSQLRTLGEAYKVCQLQRQACTPWQGLYLATLGGARALYLDDRLGSFKPGCEADFLVLRDDPNALMRRRLRHVREPAERWFVHTTLGDERSVAAVYLLGKAVSTA